MKRSLERQKEREMAMGSVDWEQLVTAVSDGLEAFLLYRCLF